MGLKEILYNYRTRSIHITELNSSKEIHLKKFDAQTSTYGMELELTGYTDGEIDLLFGPEKGNYQQQVHLEKGTVTYDFSSDWYEEGCYIYMVTNKKINCDLKLDYRFYGNAQ
jgi:hypothetical protein